MPLLVDGRTIGLLGLSFREERSFSAADRNLIGSYITSLEMAGCSITLVKLDDELTALWDAPVDTIALRWS